MQILYLKDRTRNRLEQILNIFDQDYRLSNSDHYLEVNEKPLSSDAQYLVNHLQKATDATSKGIFFDEIAKRPFLPDAEIQALIK